MISNENLYCCVILAVCGVVLPVMFGVIWKKKTKQPLKPLLLGAVTFLVFAIILESIPKMILLVPNNPIGKYIVSNIYLYSLIAALLAGIFEETGRLVAYKVFLKKYKDRLTAITYGIGHGGFEVMYLLAGVGVSYFIYGTLINSGQMDQLISQVGSVSPDQLEAIRKLPDTIAGISYPYVLASVIERISAVLIHIACSIIMFYAVHQKGKMWLYPIAILLHGTIDLIAAFYQVGLIHNLYLIEGILFVFAILVFTGCYKLIFKKMPVSY